ncbi:transmembrane and immunoglobulin domain-containing protein 2 [Monodelphis domestica]|uniref:Transmembrane and immunoglobulin domain containing 2 n=1 Tax=Monodelphis domestica TaxID=13616 RepID=K7DYU0_MONDO|nr:transmembrane and immunoglobulin domain-containing protein 2 [Monodelphis domestica]
MEYPLIDLFLLMLSGVLARGTNYTVQQEYQTLRVSEGGKVNMTCKVIWAKWEQVRVEWKKDEGVLCQSAPIKRESSRVLCGSRDLLFWIPENIVILSLDRVTPNDSGCYECHMKKEIPLLEETNKTTCLQVSGSGDFSKSDWINGYLGLLLWLLVACVMVGSGAVLGIKICRFLRRSRESVHHFYGNVLYYHQKSKEAKPGKNKTLACPVERERGESIYSTSFPKPSPRLAQAPVILPVHPRMHPATSRPIKTAYFPPTPHLS